MSFDAVAGPRPLLTLFAPLQASRTPDGMLRMDERFVAGMTLHAQNWPGPVVAVLRDGGGAERPRTRSYHPDRLAFSVRLLPPHIPLEEALESQPGVVMAAADALDHLPLVDAARRRGLGVVLGVDRTLDSRLQAQMGARGLLRRLWGIGSNLRDERRRKRALRDADGVQMNGYPVSQEYRGLNGNSIRFLDNRLGPQMLATDAGMARRRAALAQGGPLRLVHSGRLEAGLGARRLVPLAAALRDAGLSFTLVIEGGGALLPAMRHQVAQLGLQGHVELPGPLDFAGALVPLLREHADLLVSCRTLAEPSDIFLEAMGCGLPVLGFDNAMLAPLIRDSAGGWTVPQRDIGAMAHRIMLLDRDRDRIAEAAQSALDYARRHDFETEFRLRAEHLREVFLRTRDERFVPGEWLRPHGRAGS